MRFVRPLALIASVVLGALIGLFGLDAALDHLSSKRADARTEQYAPREIPVAVAPVNEATFRETVEAVGSTLAEQSIDVVPLAAGRVERIEFGGGQHVDKGQVLATLDDRNQVAALQESEALLAETRAAYERAQSLAARNITTTAALQQARSAFLRAEAAVERAKSDLADREIKAPFAGVIGLPRVEPGARVDTSTVIATLDDLDAVEIEFSVPEILFPRVAVGSRVLARSDAYGDRVFEGRVSAIDSRISTAARAFKVRATIPNQEMTLRTGMFMSLELILDERRSLSIPEVAVTTEGDKSFVYAAKDGRARRVEVKIGLRQGSAVEIVGGLTLAETVITSGVQSVEEGSLVRIVDGPGIPVAGGDVRS